MSENRIKQHKFAGKKEIIRETRRNVNVQVNFYKYKQKSEFAIFGNPDTESRPFKILIYFRLFWRH